MTAVVGALVSLAAAVLVAVASFADPLLLAAAVGFVVVVVALGWSALLRLPHPRGSALAVALTGLAGAVAAWQLANQRPLAALASVIALSVPLAFAHELFRRDGRARLLESVTGTLSGQVVAVLAAGWLLLPGTRLGADGVLVAAVAVGVARLLTAAPLPSPAAGWVCFGVAAGASVVVAVVRTSDPLPASVMGAGVAAVVAAIDRLLVHQPTSRTATGLLAAAATPVSVAGTVAYAAVRLLGG